MFEKLKKQYYFLAKNRLLVKARMTGFGYKLDIPFSDM